MVEGRIECSQILRIALGLYLAELGIPLAVGGRHISVEIIRIGFRLHVLPCVCEAHPAERYLAYHRFIARSEGNKRTRRATVDKSGVIGGVFTSVAVEKLEFAYRFGEVYYEIYLAQLRPTGYHAVSLQTVGSGLAYLRVDDAAVPASFVGGMVHIQPYVAVRPLGIGIAVKAGAGSGRKFGVNPLVV